MCACVCFYAYVCVAARAPDAQMMNVLLSRHRQRSDTEDLRSHGCLTHTHTHTHTHINSAEVALKLYTHL